MHFTVIVLTHALIRYSTTLGLTLCLVLQKCKTLQLFVNSGRCTALYSPKQNRRIMTAVLYSPIRTEFPSLIHSYPEGAPLCPNAECTGCRINNECPDPVRRERYVWRAVRPLMIRRTLASRVATEWARTSSLFIM
ncbi:hypothetical protein CDAR_97671 [Caerostris darwini]|uniref:Secreted protein n=1 Tax=Caerostris darwini TaxID=1538125 RepID=A0AAV4NHK9_9ARAC|nr:hypothetical protein CDAR_97671 [Caerostris darwini]